MFIPSNNFDLWNNRRGLWTMSAFMMFYLVAPFLYKFLKNYYWVLFVFIMLLFCHDPFVAYLEKLLETYQYISEPNVFASWTPLSVLYSFFSGIVVYRAVKEKHQFSLVVICAIAMVYNSFQWFAWDFSMMFIVLAGASFSSNKLKHEIVEKVVILLSNSGYAIYLSHMLVLEQVMKLQDYLVPVIRNKGFLILVFTFCIVVGCLVHRFIEKPLTRRINRMLRI